MTYVGGVGEGCASSVKGVEKCCMIHHVGMGYKVMQYDATIA